MTGKWYLYGFYINVKGNIFTLSGLADMGVGDPRGRKGSDLFLDSCIGSAALTVLLVLVFGILRCISLNFES